MDGIKYGLLMFSGTYYKFYMLGQNSIKHRSFIPWNTTLPNECAKQDQYVVQNLDRVKYFELNMGFTYGQMSGLNTVISCFREIASENKVKVKIDGVYTTTYTIAKFEVQGERSAKNEFYKLLTDRRKSAKCIEYTCIHWNIDMTVSDNNRSKPDQKKASKPINNKVSNITHDRNNSQCTADIAIVMTYPRSIDMIKVQLATNNTNSFMHLTTCLRNILVNQYKLISVNKTNESNKTAAIYIKPGDTAVIVVEKGMHNCYTSILLICQNTDILTKLHKQSVRTLRTLIIILLSALVFITTLFVLSSTKRFTSNKKTGRTGIRNDTDDTIHTALSGHFENQIHMNTQKSNKNVYTGNAKELTGMHFTPVHKGI